MKTIRLNLPVEYNKLPKVIALGNFDGLHRGHKILIDKVKEISSSKNIISSLLTFSINPRKLFSKDRFYELTSLEDRRRITCDMGLEEFYELEFNEEMIRLSPIDFVEKILIPLNVKYVVCGFDYTFGSKGAGKVEDLIKYSDGRFEVIVIPSFNIDGEKVSTTRIISCLKDGDIEQTNKLLGWNYTVKGRIKKGLENGRKIGFPTINVDTNDYMLPKNGVYAVKVKIEGEVYYGMGNIGVHPTIDKLEKPVLEVNIFDFDENVYEKNVEIEFIRFIREEIEFQNLDELKKQLKLDTFLIFKLIFNK